MIGQSPQDAPPEDLTGAQADAGSGPVTRAPQTSQGTHPPTPPKEWGGREGPEPPRYGDWEKNGRCIDF